MRDESDPKRAGRARTRVASAVVVALAAVGASLLASALAPAADLQSQLDAKQAKLDNVRSKEGVLTTTISRYGARITRLEGEVADLRDKEAAVRARLARKQAELDRAVAQLHQARKKLEELKRRLKRALVVLRERLVSMYEAGTPDVASVVLSARGFDQLLTQAEYLQRIRDQDETVIGRVRDLRDEMKRTVARLRAAKLRIKAARDAIAAQERAVASARAAVESHQAELVAARDQREAALAQIRANENELEGDVSSIQQKIQAQLSAVPSGALPAGPAGPVSSSGLIWPVDGPVVSGFGMRWGRMHEGIDIAVPAGTPIRAAASGSVVLMQDEASSGGYGNYTCVDHGGGLSTCYAHQSAFATSTGAAVSQGDVIGYVGCTGHCFGDHLHFEVRVNGVPQDPLGYL